MFCKSCGHEITENAKFCPNCGEPVSDEIKKENRRATPTGKLLLKVKPVFIPWVAFVSVLPIQIFLTLWGAGFLGGIGFALNQYFNINVPKGTTFIFWGIFFFFGVPILNYIANKRTYETTEYKFYDDHLEYSEGFWTSENKSIKYRSVLETSLRKGILQKKYGLGTIYLSTPATGFSAGRSKSGISISNIPNVDKIYGALKKIIEEQQK